MSLSHGAPGALSARAFRLAPCRGLRRALVVFAFCFAAASLVLTPRDAEAGNRPECNSNCGGLNQIACLIIDCIPSCDKFLYESVESCGFFCTQSICRDSGCGDTNERACVPFVDHGWPDVCKPGNYNAAGTCRALDADGFPTVCGDQNERACTLAEHIPSCKTGLVEVVNTSGSFCRLIDADGYPSHCGDTGEPPCQITERIPSCKGDDFEYGGLCTNPDADGYPTFCGGLNETPCDLGLQVQLGITSCKPRLEEDFALGICLDACGGNGLPACAIGGCDPGHSGQGDDMIDNLAVCGKAPVAWGESDVHEAAPGGPRVVFFIHGRGNDLTTSTYDANEPLLNELAFASPNIVAVYGVDWNNQATGAFGARRRVEIHRLVMQGSAPAWELVQRYGRRTFNSTDFQISDVSQAIAQAIDDLDITTPITLLGHSYGGVIARDLVYRHYDDLRAGNHKIVEVVTIKSPHRGGLIGTPDLVSPGALPETGLQLQTDFACATGRVSGLAGVGSGQEGCLLGRWVDWSLGKAPFGIDDTSYPQIRWVAVAGGGHRTAASSIDLVLDAEVAGVPIPLDSRFEALLEIERDELHEPFLDSDATVPTRSAFGIAVDACYPYVQALPPGGFETGATIRFDTTTWVMTVAPDLEVFQEATSATCYHAAATTGPMPLPRAASNHDLSSDEDERAFVVTILTVPCPNLPPGWDCSAERSRSAASHAAGAAVSTTRAAVIRSHESSRIGALRTRGRWPMFSRFLKLLGAAALVALLAFFAIVVWLGLRDATYAQRDDEVALVRKRAELAWMHEQARSVSPSPARRPNVVLILFDDLGLGDVGAYGSRALETPRIDRLAREGALFETFYAPAPYCTPSRAGFLTGRWPIRTTLTQVVFPRGHPIHHVHRISGQPIRLPADEILLPEALRAAGYATGMVGKWHLGDESPSLPNELGFDDYYGVLHSNDMAPLPLWRDREIAEPHPIDQRLLTPRYTDEAVAWIERHAEGPFFLHFAHSFPHIPLHATPEQAGQSDAGLYGDVVADLDASVGRIVDALARLGIDDETLVLVTSDNGPWFEGSAGAVRGRKNEVFEGGMRVPFIAWWPGRISPRRVAAPAAGVDVLPTLLGLAGVPLPRDRAIDGVDLAPVLFEETGEARLAERPIYYFSGDALLAVRIGRWKLHARHGVFGGTPGHLPIAPLLPQGPWLFDLARDPDESYDVHERHPDAFARLDEVRTAFERELAEQPRGWRF